MKLRTWELDALQERFEEAIAADQVPDSLLPYLCENLPFDSGRWNPLGHAANTGKARALAQMLRAGADSCFQWNGGKHALLVAGIHGQTQCVEVLAEAGAEATLRDNRGNCFFTYCYHSENGLLTAYLRGRKKGGWPLAKVPPDRLSDTLKACWLSFLAAAELDEAMPQAAPTSGRRRL